MVMHKMCQDLTEQNTPTGPAVSHVPVVAPAEISLQEWADRAMCLYQNTVASLIAFGQFLLHVKKSVRHGEWGKIFRDHPQHVPNPMPFTSRTGHMFIEIAEHHVLRNNCSILPFSVRTLYELSRHPPELATRGIEKGLVCPEMERREAEKLEALINGWDPDAPDEFPLIDDHMEFEHECPKCHYQW